MKTIKLTIWSLVSLLMFLALNYIMHLPAIGMHADDLSRTNIMALVLFGVPLFLTVFRLRIGFYLLSLVQLIYSVGYLSAMYQVVMISHANWLSKIMVVLVAIIALGINLYWFTLAWRFRKATAQERAKRYMKFRE
ncbi:hypothetical protein ACQW5G_02760 [Fructilactobacillus sp. Tb1]|uniref:hypothetical protein n=1 Tax=Fructilactobacillus sp. Tb1 TaxID=3422304 RepID=UPI003D29F93C